MVVVVVVLVVVAVVVVVVVVCLLFDASLQPDRKIKERTKPRRYFLRPPFLNAI